MYQIWVAGIDHHGPLPACGPYHAAAKFFAYYESEMTASVKDASTQTYFEVSREQAEQPEFKSKVEAEIDTCYDQNQTED